MTTTLLVIVPDRMSDLITKGEITPRYYNPGEVFDQVHLLLLNDDKVLPSSIQQTVGRAHLTVHNVVPPKRFFLRTAGWQPILLKDFTQQIQALAKTIKPDIIRTHGSQLSLVAAHAIKTELSVPWVASLHNNLDYGNFDRGMDRIRRPLDVMLCKRVLPDADLVMPVYQSIIPFLNRIGVTKIVTGYNVISNPVLKKEDYSLYKKPRLISVGRLIPGKNPTNFITAAKNLDLDLTIIGDGPLSNNITGAHHIRSMMNREICKRLMTYDIFLSNCQFPGIPKTIMEAMLAGLPVITNKPPDDFPYELKGSVLNCLDTVDGYTEAIIKLMNNELREKIGLSGFKLARSLWDPKKSEQNIASCYRTLI